ncbi:unnamed protein product [Ambrosiozyma monospora]|uniref:Unnamed protein product n=1 Tax=Ambrosiozyma monospora TaxID=43982 RepID=A0ACB5TC44_AMBMO|nr:unnamed protein product [Ambrosiozyma monospora]
MVVDPNGNVVVEAGHGEEIVYAELKPEEVDEVRQNIPIGKQRRRTPKMSLVLTPHLTRLTTSRRLKFKQTRIITRLKTSTTNSNTIPDQSQAQSPPKNQLTEQFKTKYKLTPSCPPPKFDSGCTYCKPPKFPADKQIDYSKPLRNTKSNPWKHAIVLSGDSNFKEWPSRFEMDPAGSIISDVHALKRRILDPFHPCVLSMTSFEEKVHDVDHGANSSGVDGKEQVVKVGVYPDGIAVHVPRSKVEEFMIGYLTPIPETNEETKLSNPDLFELGEVQKQLRSEFYIRPVEYDYVLICGHAKRDVRCGEMAPLIKNEFEAVLSRDGLLANEEADGKGDKEENEGKVKVGIVSHIGGHVYAGNVLIFKRNGDVIWYGHVLPSHVQGIVEETIKGEKIIEELYRGA